MVISDTDGCGSRRIADYRLALVWMNWPDYQTKSKEHVDIWHWRSI